MNTETKNQMSLKRRRIQLAGVVVVVLSLILASCAPATPATPDQSAVNTMVAATLAAQPAPTQPPAPTTPPAQPTVASALPQPTPNPNIPEAVVPTPVPGGPSLTANFNTLIYSGPGTNYVVYGTLLGGKTALPIGKSQDGTWWAISVPPAPLGQGWVVASMAAVTNGASLPVIPAPPVPPTTSMVPPGPNDPQGTAIANVYVRTGPGPQFPAYGIAVAGQSGRIIGKSTDGKYWVVRLNPANVGAGYGWADAAFIQASNVNDVPVIQSPPASTPQPLPPPAAGTPTVTAIEFVNVRSGPGTNYPAYGIAAPGATAQVTGKSQDGAWWQIKIPTTFAPDGLGWVSAGYVIPQDTASVPVVAAPPAPPTTITPAPPAAATCQIVSQTPADNSVLAANTAYTFTWVIKNTSTTKWDQSEYDVIYISSTTGYSMHSGSDVYDLPSTVDPGQTVTISGSGITPATAGPYAESWAISKGSTPVCPFYVVFQVQ